MSCYAPGWFKKDTKRFPRAMTAEGKQMEIASCFSDNVLQADLKAFSALKMPRGQVSDIRYLMAEG